MTNSDIAIRVQNLSKRYRIGLEEEVHDTFASMLTDVIRRPAHNLRRLRRLTRFSDNGYDPNDIIWALKDVSFEVKRGEVVGVIGRNGAGKSTLLKILSRITHPTSGRVELKGRVSSLLEVGTGFHPELTGRENIYLNGTILGMRKAEIDRKFDEIVDFSGVEKFIDTPVKRYSSGMRVRLAFSVAAHLEPEILLVDEVLAVGDAAFQKRCVGKMQDVARRGRTVLFVSHNMGAVNRLCASTLLLEGGELQLFDATERVVGHYLTSDVTDGERRWEEGVANPDTFELEVHAVRICARDGSITSVLDARFPYWIEVDHAINQTLPSCRVGIIITTIEGITVLQSYDIDNGVWPGPRMPGQFTSRCQLPENFLSPGTFTISVNIGIKGMKNLVWLENVLVFEVENTSITGTDFFLNRRGVVNPKLDWEMVGDKSSD